MQRHSIQCWCKMVLTTILIIAAIVMFLFFSAVFIPIFTVIWSIITLPITPYIIIGLLIYLVLRKMGKIKKRFVK